MANFTVLLTQSARHDLHEIIEFIELNDGVTNARKLLASLKKKISSLVTFPLRGNFPKELLRIGIKTFRELHQGHYRILYEVVDKKIYIHMIVDGRRDFYSLLEQRILGIEAVFIKL